MNSKRKWIVESLRLTGLLLQQQWVSLAVLFFISCLLNLTAEDAMQSAGPSEETQRYVLQVGLGVWDLCEGIALILILSWGVPKVRALTAAGLLPQPFAQQHYISSFLAEYLRVLAQILMWAILLLIPGFLRYCQLIFVPLITLFSKAYRAGEVDALKLSDTLAKGRLQILALTLGLNMILQFCLELLPNLVPELHIYFVRIALALIIFLISVWTYALVFLVFEHAIEELENTPKELAATP